MHPRQASLLVEAEAVLARMTVGKTALAGPPTSGPILLWEYEDPDGKKFYLQVRKTTIKSPFSGKSFPAQPQRYTPAQVGKELKDERKERKEQAKKATEEDLVTYVTRLAAGSVVLYQYRDPDGNLFWLDRKIMTTIRSPYGGPAFHPEPQRIAPSQLSKILKQEKQEAEKADSGMSDADDPNDLQAFAKKVNAVALSPQCKKFHNDRAFISSVKELGFPYMPRAKFDSMLLEAHRATLIRMTRADLVGAMDPKLVADSEVKYMSATFHFIALDHLLPKPW